MQLVTEVFGRSVGLQCKCGFATEPVAANDPDPFATVERAITAMAEHLETAHAPDLHKRLGMCPYCQLIIEAPDQQRMAAALLRHAMQEHLDR